MRVRGLLVGALILEPTTPAPYAFDRDYVVLLSDWTDQDPMTNHGIGFLARSRLHPERVATCEDWLGERMEHLAAG